MNNKPKYPPSMHLNLEDVLQEKASYFQALVQYYEERLKYLQGIVHEEDVLYSVTAILSRRGFNRKLNFSHCRTGETENMPEIPKPVQDAVDACLKGGTGYYKSSDLFPCQREAPKQMELNLDNTKDLVEELQATGELSTDNLLQAAFGGRVPKPEYTGQYHEASALYPKYIEEGAPSGVKDMCDPKNWGL